MRDLDEIVDVFELLGDWDARYQYLVELGEQLEPMPDAERTEENRVKGCMSQVWVYAYPDPDDPARIRFHGDCDTATIKGVVALLVKLASGKTLEELDELDVDEIFERLDLHEHLSPNRHVGVYAMVEMMKAQARRVAAQRPEVA